MAAIVLNVNIDFRVVGGIAEIEIERRWNAAEAIPTKLIGLFRIRMDEFSIICPKPINAYLQSLVTEDCRHLRRIIDIDLVVLTDD